VVHTVELRPSARRELLKFARHDQLRLIRAMDALAANPCPKGVKKLTGLDDLYRIRVGDYRIVYQVHDDRLIVLVVRTAFASRGLKESGGWPTSFGGGGGDDRGE
jgi:mRNA interferase RelE/StbE